MIWKKSQMKLGTEVLIHPVELQEEKVSGKFGDQDKWWVEVGGDSATLYTPYRGSSPDPLGQLLRQGNVTVSKYFDETNQRPGYSYNPAGGEKPGRSETQTNVPKSGQPPLSNNRSFEIAYEALYKGVASPDKTPEENHSAVMKAMELMIEASNNHQKEVKEEEKPGPAGVPTTNTITDGQFQHIEALMVKSNFGDETVKKFLQYLTAERSVIKGGSLATMKRSHAQHLINNWEKITGQFFGFKHSDDFPREEQPEGQPEEETEKIPF